MRCPCGYLTDPKRACRCTPPQIERYLSRVSGPLLDRIDIHLEVPAVPFEELRTGPAGAGSEAMRADVERARSLQRRRFEGDPFGLNGRMTGKQIRRFCKLDAMGETILKAAVEELGLSIRAHDRVLRVARTIADLADAESVDASHVAEAVQLRRLDRKLWR